MLGAASLNSNTLIVSFSKEVQGGADGAEFAGHYSMVSSNMVSSNAVRTTARGVVAPQASGRVVRPLSLAVVVKAVLSPDKKSVTLTTLDQAAIEYTLKVVNVKDLQGNPVIPPDRNNPFQVKFTGKDPTGVKKDTDGDGVEDFFEQLGWDVEVFSVNGTRSVVNVTSDPFNKDTEGDGLSDLGEISNALDPRSSDTDGDRLLDTDEINVWLTDGARVDTDGDKLADGNEVEQFKTNPRDPDTDGDTLLDFAEVVTKTARNASLPRVNIQVGSVGLQLDYRFDETTNSGTTTGTTKSTAITTLQAQQTAQAQENSTTYDWFAKAAVEVCVFGSCDGGKAPYGVKFTGEAGAGGSYSFASSTSSEQSAQREYAQTLVDDTQAQQGQSVTRTLVGAKMLLNATLTNDSPWAFEVSNLEIRAERRDPTDPKKLIPVATFKPLPNTVTSLSPISPTQQVVALDADNPIPSVVDDLMSAPENLIFSVSQYKITVKDRAQIYTDQDVLTRTGFLEIDYAGRAKLERFRPAAYFGYDDKGNLKGITLKQVMEEIVGLRHVVATPSGNGCTEATPPDQLDSSYSTCVINNVQALWRVRSVSRVSGQPFSWAVLTPTGSITPLPEAKEPLAGSDFNSLVVLPGQELGFRFIEDKDKDGLDATEEARLGSDDTKLDSDDDGVSDIDEVRGPVDPITLKRAPWLVTFDDGRDAIRVTSNPGRKDSDNDGLSDCQELGLFPANCSTISFKNGPNGTVVIPTFDPNNVMVLLGKRTNPSERDTDADGLTDLQEVVGVKYKALNDRLVPEDKILEPRRITPNSVTVSPAINPLSRNTDGDNLPDGKEITIGTNPLVNDGDKVFDDDLDGLINIEETALRRVITEGVSTAAYIAGENFGLLINSDPNKADTDGDGLNDKEERTAKTNPRLIDSDVDGLTDFAELRPTSPTPATNPLDADSDNDKLSDGFEVKATNTYRIGNGTPQLIVYKPNVADEDRDGLVDGDERFGGIFYTDPNNFDTDGDGTDDKIEIGRQSGSDANKKTDPLRPDQLLNIFFQARGVPFTNNLICGVINGGSANFRGTFSATISNTITRSFGFDTFIAAEYSQEVFRVPDTDRFVVINQPSIRVRSGGLSRYDGGTRYSLNDFDETIPGIDPKTFLSQQLTKTYKQRQAGANDDVCTLEVQFVATPIIQ